MTKCLLMQLQRGNVVLCRMPMPVAAKSGGVFRDGVPPSPPQLFKTGLAQFKLHRAVVVCASQLNQILDDVMVMSCTFNTSRSQITTQYLITADEILQAGITVESVVRCNQFLHLTNQ